MNGTRNKATYLVIGDNVYHLLITCPLNEIYDVPFWTGIVVPTISQVATGGLINLQSPEKITRFILVQTTTHLTNMCCVAYDFERSKMASITVNTPCIQLTWHNVLVQHVTRFSYPQYAIVHWHMFHSLGGATTSIYFPRDIWW